MDPIPLTVPSTSRPATTAQAPTASPPSTDVPPLLRNKDGESPTDPARQKPRSDNRRSEKSDHTTELSSNPGLKTRRFSNDEAINRPLADLISGGNIDAVASRLRQFPSLLNHPDKLSSLTPLCLAAAKGQTAIVDLLLDEGAQINKISKNDSTPLMLAAAAGHTDVVRLLCDRGALVNLTNITDNETALHMAARQGNGEVVDLLIQAKANVNLQDDDGATPLMLACKMKHCAVAKTLIANGSAIDVSKPGTHETALCIACRNGQSALVALLLEHGAEVNTFTKYGGSPLMEACDEGHIAIAKMLLDGGAVITPPESTDINALSLACKTGSLDLVTLILSYDAKFELPTGTRALLVACKNGHTAIAKLLLEKGVAIDALDHDGRSALSLACASGATDLVNLLLRHDAEINTLRGDNPLITACKKGHTAIAKLLLDKGALVDFNDPRKGTALHNACKSGALDLVTLLLERGAAIDLTDKYENTPLIAALENGHINIATFLVNKGANVNVPDESGETALSLACKNGNLNLVTLLIERGAAINTVNDDDETLLMIAVHKGHSAIARLLLGKGADIEAISGDGDNALSMACRKGHVELVSLLLALGAVIHSNTSAVDPLAEACMQGHTAVAEILISHGANINIVSAFGDTPLSLACTNGAAELVALLLRHGAIVNPDHADANVPLIRACGTGSTAVAKVLIAAGADINAVDSRGSTALKMACEMGTPDLVKLLLENGATGINQKNAFGDTVLMRACKLGHTGVAESLIAAGADTNITDASGNTAFELACMEGKTQTVAFMLTIQSQRRAIDRIDQQGRTPLMHACSGGHGAIAQLLIASGASINVRDQDGNTASSLGLVQEDRGNPYAQVFPALIDVLIAAHAYLDSTNQNGMTALHNAVINKNIKLVRNLVSAGADLAKPVSAGSKQGRTALDLALLAELERPLLDRNYRLVEYLLLNNATPGLSSEDSPIPLITLTDPLSLDLVRHAALLAAPETVPSHGLANTLIIDEPDQFLNAFIEQIRLRQTATTNWKHWLSAEGVSQLIIEDIAQRFEHLGTLAGALAGPGQKSTVTQQSLLTAQLLSTLTETNHPEPYAGRGLSTVTQDALHHMMQQQRTLLAEAGVASEKAFINGVATNLVDEALGHYNINGDWNHAGFYKSLTKQGGLYAQNANRLVTLFQQALLTARQYIINTPVVGTSMAQGQATLSTQLKSQVATHFKKLLQKSATSDKAPPGFQAGLDSLQVKAALGYFHKAVFSQWELILVAQGITPPRAPPPSSPQ